MPILPICHREKEKKYQLFEKYGQKVHDKFIHFVIYVKNVQKHMIF